MTQFSFIALEEVREFLKGLPEKVMRKILSNIDVAEKGLADKDTFKKLPGTDGIWEIRTIYLGNYYRVFAFWDTEIGAFVIGTHGIVKKSRKAPSKEIAKAERIKRMYFANKYKK